jgi:CarD family transcriptional regulator
MSLAQKTGKSKQAAAPKVQQAEKTTSAKTDSVKTSPAKASASKASAPKASVSKVSVAKAAVSKPAIVKTPGAVALKALSAARKSASEKAVDAAQPTHEKKLVSSKAPAPAPVSAPPVPVETAAAAAARMASAARKVEKPKAAPLLKRNGFAALEYIVYPAHGVGQIVAVEEQEVAGFKLELFVISFIKDKMILKVPVPKVVSVGMRKLADEPIVKRSLDTLTGRARVKRTMWSRRAQEYEAKINSGDLIAIAEVVRDLYRSEAQPEQSYSERQLYEAALDRIAREIGTVLQLTETEALKLIETNLQKGPRRTRVEDAEVEADDTGVEEEAA